MKKWTWLIGLSLVLLSFLTVMEKGADYFGKSYTETEEFQSEISRFTEGLLLFELAPPKTRADQSVASWEIDEYRMETGSLADQIQAVRDQYADAIMAADESGDSALVEELEEQRTEELTAVRESFSNDEAAKKAILSQREAQREETLRQLASQKAQFAEETSGYAYRLRDLDSGEEFTAGTLVEQPYFEQSYSAQDPLYSSGEYWHYGFTEDGALAPSPEHRFAGVIQFPDKAAAAEFTGGSGQFQFIKVLMYLFLLLAAAGAVWLFKKRPIRMEWYTAMKEFAKWRRLPFEWKLFAFIMTGLLAWASGSRFWAILSGPWYEADFGFLLKVSSAAALSLVFIAFGILQAIWLWKHFGNRRTFIEEMRESFSSQQLHAASDAFLERSIGFQMAWVLGVMFLWGAGTALMTLQPVLVIVWLPATVLIGVPSLLFLMTRFGYLNRLLRGTQQLAEGHFGAQLAVKGKSPLARHAKHLNLLREGYQQSVSERSKSERLKTELITNVSHDLRTPLTSIITYTDLLKNEDLVPEERRKYVDILDRKSERLKVLIEDLFEVSKMASGNAEITKQRLDIGQLVAQALAEHEEALKDAALDVRVGAQEQPIYASVDGQKWWRLLDNLILNATKYSLPGSRVYIGLEEQQGELSMTVKNVTRYELGDSTDELLERFKRGDTSRQTEGSGLGLAIAQSIVDLHGGKMALEVDGDLFKVTVTLPNS